MSTLETIVHYESQKYTQFDGSFPTSHLNMLLNLKNNSNLSNLIYDYVSKKKCFYISTKLS